MAQANPLRNGFNAGEFSILVEGRVDLDRYPAAMRRMENFIAAPQGPAMRRSGTQFVAAAASPDKASKLVPFIRSDTDVVMLEFADGIIRFVYETGLLAKTGSPNEAYTISSPFTSEYLATLRYVQSVDVMYLFCQGLRPYKLSRYGIRNWRLTQLDFKNGPFLPEGDYMGQIKLSSRGTDDTGVASATSTRPGYPVTNLFDESVTTYWAGDSDKDEDRRAEDTITYILPEARTLEGYVVYPQRSSASDEWTALDVAPASWTLQASVDGVSDWVVLDRQSGYVLWDDYRSVLFKIKNREKYKGYRFAIEAVRTALRRAAGFAFLSLKFSDDAVSNITVDLSGDYADVNGGQGFLDTDVGRLMRVLASDNRWRVLRIVQRVNEKRIVAKLISEPFMSVKDRILRWQLGAWSETTGWPNCGVLYDDRLWLAGSRESPDLLAGSIVSSYEDFEQRNSQNEVLDSSAVVVRLNSRKLSSIRWIKEDDRGLLVGTGTQEWLITAANPDEQITARNVRARPQSERGSANVESVKVDSAVLYVQNTGRTVREYGYVFENDGFRAPSMSLFASHLGAPKFAEMAYASEPHSIVWFRRQDGTVVGLTYNKDEKVIGWHRHSFAGGSVESIAVMPSSNDGQDSLWMCIRREVGGTTRRYIERLTRFWDFDSTLSSAFFVDCGVRRTGAQTDVVPVPHLDGEQVSGLVDGRVVRDLPVVGGLVTLPFKGQNVVLGLRYTSIAETTPIEAGSQVGTAQGKQKRINALVLHVWDSSKGEIATYNEDKGVEDWQDVEYLETYDEMQPPKLSTERIGRITMGAGYGKGGTLLFRQRDPLPFNVISLMPEMTTYDG